MMQQETKTAVVVLGSVPPPVIGPSVVNETLLRLLPSHDCTVYHLNMSDTRSVTTLNVWDMTNVWLACTHYGKLMVMLMTKRIDVVYMQLCQTTVGFLRDLPFILLAKLWRKRIVIHFHGGYFDRFYRRLKFPLTGMVRYALRQVDSLIVLGPCLKNMFQGLVPDERMIVIPNGCRSMYNPRYTKGPYTKILFLSNLFESKGVFDVLQCIPVVVKEEPRVHVIFAGAWSSEEFQRKCMHYVEQEKINAYITWMGIVNEEKKEELFNSADIFVFPSREEAQGIVAVEALAAGLPVIISREGCMKDYVTEGREGFLIEKGDVKKLSEKLLYLVQYTQIRETYGKAARELYEREFTLEHFMDRMRSVLIRKRDV